MKVCKIPLSKKEIRVAILYSGRFTESLTLLTENLRNMVESVEIVDIYQSFIGLESSSKYDLIIDWLTPIHSRDYKANWLFQQNYAVCAPSILASQSLESKISQYLVFKKMGLPVIKTIQVPAAEVFNNQLAVLGECPHGWVVKPNRSSQGIGVMRFFQRVDLLSFFEFMQLKGDLDFVIQPLIQFQRDLRLVYSGGESAVFERRASVEDFRGNLAKGATWIHLSEDPVNQRLFSLAHKIHVEFGLEIFALDCFELDEDLSLLEINLRPGFNSLKRFQMQNMLESAVRAWVNSAKKNCQKV